MKILSYCAVLLCVIVLVGCPTPPPPIADPVVSVSTLPPKSNNLNVDVYIDSTLSMKGYVSTTNFTQYMQTIDCLEGSISTGWNLKARNYFQFSDKIVQLQQRPIKKIVMKPSFFDGRFTLISEVLKQKNISASDNLSVIITDLYENQANLDLLSDLLKEQCLSKGISVGVIGIKSQFEGKVFGAGINNAVFHFKSNDADPSTFRPFYIIAIGGQADVITLFDQLKRNLPFISKDNFTLFSSIVVDPIATFDGNKRISPKNLNNTTNLVRTASNRVIQLSVLDDSDAKVTYEINLKQVPYTLGLNGAELELKEIEGKDFYNGREVGKSDGLVLKNVSIKDSILSMPLKIKPGGLVKNHSYQYHIVITAKKETYKIPAWWKQWDLKVANIALNNNIIDGSKTQNFFIFMDSLMQKNHNIKSPILFDSYVYLKK